MPTPIEPGHYLWRPCFHMYEGAWCPREIDDDGKPCSADLSDGQKDLGADEDYGEWGERIPDSPRLKAMKELAAIDHVYCDGSDYERNHCLACGAEDEWCHVRTQPAGRKVFGWKLTHTPHCPWPRAQETPS